MQKVIGLDIGSYSIKAIEIVNTFKSYEIVDFYETVIPCLPNVPLDAVVAVCMEQLFQENHLEADRIITAMPGQFISSRILPFNFSDPGKIQASVMVELEELVPFNLEDMVVDHQILGSVKGQTLALAVMTRKAFLRNFLELLARIDIDPKLVDIDSLAFYNLSSHLDLETNQNVVMVDVGHEKTSVCIVRDGVLRVFRSINLGGRYITDFLARDLETDFFEAQRIKHRVSRVTCESDQADDVTGVDKSVIERMTFAASAIVKELGRTFYAFKSWDQEPLKKVYLSGGTSAITNFDRLLEEQLEVNVERLRLGGSDLKIGERVSARMDVVPQSLAIGLRAVSTVKNHSQINLRRGEFAFVQNYESLLKVGAWSFRMIAVVLALLVVSYVFKHYFYMAQIEDLKKNYEKVLISQVPEMKKRIRKKKMSFRKLRKEGESRLRQEINVRRSATEEFRMANSSTAPLEVMLGISRAIPADTLVDVTLLDYRATVAGEGRLRLKAETDGFASQSKIIDALKGVAVLKNIEEKSSATKPGSDGKVIEFTIEADYKPASGV